MKKWLLSHGKKKQINRKNALIIKTLIKGNSNQKKAFLTNLEKENILKISYEFLKYDKVLNTIQIKIQFDKI